MLKLYTARAVSSLREFPSPNPQIQVPLTSIQLRQATFVLPRTGQRVKGLVNLHNPAITGAAANEDSANDERRGLLTGEIETHHDGIVQRISARARGFASRSKQFVASEQGIGILKFSLAYLLGSCATFIPAVSNFLGQNDGKHMVATVTVYFHPARSQGSMFRALICALLAFCYSAFLSVSSMLFESLFQDVLMAPALGHALVLIVFCGGGLGFVGWTKQRLGDPLVNVACSLASLSTITVLTKEGAVQSGDLSLRKISQVLKMVIMGVVAATMVSFLIFPISARKKLRASLVTSADTLAVMLAMITESFLSGSEDVLKSEEFLEAEAKHRKAYSQLDNLVREAKLEHFVAGTEKEYRLEKHLVRWVQDITHNLGGLRSAASLQFSLIRETIARESGSSSENSHPQGSLRFDYFASLERSWSYPDGSILEPIEERSEEDYSPSGTLNSPSSKKDDSNERNPLLPADVFTIFISHLGPAMVICPSEQRQEFTKLTTDSAPWPLQ